MRQAYDDYVNRNWKPNVRRLDPVSGCACSSCQLHRQLKNEWDRNEQQAAEFKRHLQEQTHGKHE